jgi:hypothetical protein
MRKTVVLKKDEPTIEESIAYLTDKCEYFLVKVQNYDRALNEFNLLKLKLDEILETHKKSLQFISQSNDAINSHSFDLQTLTNRIREGDDLLHETEFSLNQRIDSLKYKVDDEGKARLSDIQNFYDFLDRVLESYPTNKDISAIDESNQENFKALTEQIFQSQEDIETLLLSKEEFSSIEPRINEKILNISKDICRIQNAIVRLKAEGVKHD